jgi:hypothetical protein
MLRRCAEILRYPPLASDSRPYSPIRDAVTGDVVPWTTPRRFQDVVISAVRRAALDWSRYALDRAVTDLAAARLYAPPEIRLAWPTVLLTRAQVEGFARARWRG